MTTADLTHIYFLLDRSGSMHSIKLDTEGGFDAFINEQRRTPGRCRVTLAQFDNQYEVVYQGLDVTRVPPLTLQPRGSTALLDSMGRLIGDAGAELARLPEKDRPGTVLVAIMTDGIENSSIEWTRPAIRSLVEQQTTAYNWQFLYMGADQDAIEVGASIGVAGGHSMTYSRGSSASAMAAASENIAELRTSRLTHGSATLRDFDDVQRRAAENTRHAGS